MLREKLELLSETWKINLPRDRNVEENVAVAGAGVEVRVEEEHDQAEAGLPYLVMTRCPLPF